MGLSEAQFGDLARRAGAVSVGVNAAALRPPEPAGDEKAFQAEVFALARRNGWLCYHTHNSRKSEQGFPDCVFVRARVVWAELKTEEGRTDAAQDRWAEALRAAGAEYHLWRPSDWPLILEVLK